MATYTANTFSKLFSQSFLKTFDVFAKMFEQAAVPFLKYPVLTPRVEARLRFPDSALQADGLDLKTTEHRTYTSLKWV